MTATALTVRGLSAGYADGGQPVTVLEDLEFELAPGERLAVVGKSGGGKSTLLHVLAGLLAPTAGEVLVGERAAAPVGAAAQAVANGHAAYMFQHDLLLPWKTVLDNAVFAADVAARGAREDGGGARWARATAARKARPATRARARTILEEFGLGDVLGALPRQLSGGMRQRVALARTLVLGRGLVLLDEPFGSLDALTRAEMQSWLLDVMAAHPATWVLVTHDVREAVLLGDRVAVLGGRPARLEGWVDVPLGAHERRALAADTLGEGRTNAVDLDATAQMMRRLTAQVRGRLGQRREA